MARMVLRVKPTWWLIVYLRTLCFLCLLMGTRPDMGKVARWVDRGMKFEIVRKRA